MNILITGGAGHIGNVVTEECLAAGHNAIVVDSLISGDGSMVHPKASFYKADIRDTAAVREILRRNRIEAVIHMASSIAGNSLAGKHVYIAGDVRGGMSLLSAMSECGVRKIIFSSTLEVYGEHERQPIDESAELCPTNTNGITNVVLEKALKWYRDVHGIRCSILRIAHVFTAGLNRGHSKNPGSDLIQQVLDTARGVHPMIRIHGNNYPTSDGTFIRDYVHVRDLARAYILTLNGLERGNEVYNLCSGRGYSVREVIEAARKVTGRLIPFIYCDRHPGEPPVIIASPGKIMGELGWRPEFSDLTSMIESAWEWGNEYQKRAKSVG